jgi:hypothetical protein
MSSADQPLSLPVVLPARWRRLPDTTTWCAPGAPPPATIRCRLSATEPGLEPDDVDVEDEDAYEIGAAEARYTRFGHGDGPDHLLSDRWVWPIEGGWFVLTGTVERAGYPAYCDVFEEVARTFTAPVDPAA